MIGSSEGHLKDLGSFHFQLCRPQPQLSTRYSYEQLREGELFWKLLRKLNLDDL